MAKPQISTKRLAISKANAQIVMAVGAGAFITVFCLIAAQTVWNQNKYQSKVVEAKEKAHRQLQDNTKAYKSLARSYQKFNAASKNVIGGSKDGQADKDGNNSKIVLNALPTTYDFPALTSSVEKIVSAQGLKTTDIGGTDDQIKQQTNLSSPDPKAIEIPFAFTVEHADYEAANRLVTSLERSIRPMHIDSLQISSGTNDVAVTVNAHTYYQSTKNLKITKKVVEK